MATWVEHPLHLQFRDLGFADFIDSAGDALAGEACLQLTGLRTAAEAIPVLDACYALVGTTARVDEVCLTLHRWLGLPPPRAERENVTQGQGHITLDSRRLDRLLALTREDRLLFEHVAQRHAGLMAAPGVAL